MSMQSHLCCAYCGPCVADERPLINFEVPAHLLKCYQALAIVPPDMPVPVSMLRRLWQLVRLGWKTNIPRTLSNAI